MCRISLQYKVFVVVAFLWLISNFHVRTTSFYGGSAKYLESKEIGWPLAFLSWDETTDRSRYVGVSQSKFESRFLFFHSRMENTVLSLRYLLVVIAWWGLFGYLSGSLLTQKRPRRSFFQFSIAQILLAQLLVFFAMVALW